MSMLTSIGGGQSALGIHDMGTLELLDITRLASAKAIETALWKTRTSYETRNSAGVTYYLRVDKASKRVAAFATTDGLPILGTREDLLANALSLIASKNGDALARESCFTQASQAAKAPGVLRMR